MKNKIKAAPSLFRPESWSSSSFFYLAKELISRFSLKNTFISLRYRNYRLWFWGQMISLFGTWMQGTALSFFIFELTHSSAYLGYMGFATGLPMWFFATYGGVIADRFSRRSLLLGTQSFMMLLAVVLSALTFTHVIQPWFMLILAFFLGIAQAFDAPARQALVAELVPREDLTNAIALNSTMVNMAFFLGPAISGLIYTYFGPAWCFLINGLSFLAVIISLILIKLQPSKKKETGNSVFEDLGQGLKYLRQQPLILALITNIAVLSLLGSGTLTLLPAWAVRMLHGDARTNGWLQSARGLGALVGALFIASLGRFHFRGRLLTLGAFSLPLLMIIFSFASHLGLSLLILFIFGLAIIVVANLSNSLVQGLVDDAIRGRVMGLYALAFFGFMPLGSLWIGQMAEILGERQAVLLNAGLFLAFLTTIWVLRPEIKKLE
jgi:MFS family permease